MLSTSEVLSDARSWGAGGLLCDMAGRRVVGGRVWSYATDYAVNVFYTGQSRLPEPGITAVSQSIHLVDLTCTAMLELELRVLTG